MFLERESGSFLSTFEVYNTTLTYVNWIFSNISFFLDFFLQEDKLPVVVDAFSITPYQGKDLSKGVTWGIFPTKYMTSVGIFFIYEILLPFSWWGGGEKWWEMPQRWWEWFFRALTFSIYKNLSLKFMLKATGWKRQSEWLEQMKLWFGDFEILT